MTAERYATDVALLRRRQEELGDALRSRTQGALDKAYRLLAIAERRLPRHVLRAIGPEQLIRPQKETTQ